MARRAGRMPALPALRQLTFVIEGTYRRAEMVADIGSNHGAHAELLSSEIACQTADVKRGDRGVQRVHPFVTARGKVRKCLRDESSNDAGQGVASARGTQSGVAGWIDEDATIGRGNQTARAFQ